MLSSSYDNSGTGITYCPVLIILISKRCYKPVVLSEGREREDLNLAQNVFSEVFSFANQEASCSFKRNDILEMDYLFHQCLSGFDFKRKKSDPT